MIFERADHEAVCVLDVIPTTGALSRSQTVSGLGISACITVPECSAEQGRSLSRSCYIAYMRLDQVRLLNHYLCQSMGHNPPWFLCPCASREKQILLWYVEEYTASKLLCLHALTKVYCLALKPLWPCGESECIHEAYMHH